MTLSGITPGLGRRAVREKCTGAVRVRERVLPDGWFRPPVACSLSFGRHLDAVFARGTMTNFSSAPCQSCGVALTADSAFCLSCGVKILRDHDTTIGEAPAPSVGGQLEVSWSELESRLRDVTAGDYEIIRELGRGGQAAVFLATERALNRRVAVKVMSPSVMSIPGMMDRFYAEAITQANLSHANIVSVYAVRQLQDLHLFTMQYIPGRSLQQAHRAELAAGRPLPFAVIRALLFQVGSALAYAHRRGVIHRDVKPANIMLNADGDAIVTDFGIAKVSTENALTMTGTILGTSLYMSPEQCYAAPLTGASDQYSLGVTAYELLTGRPPFEGSTFAIMQAHATQAPRPVGEVISNCPPELAHAVMRMLSKDAKDRFPEIGAALQAMDARPASPAQHDPLRQALIALADVPAASREVDDLIRVPLSPMPRPRQSGESDWLRSPVGGGGAGVNVASLHIAGAPSEIITGARARLTAAARTSSGVEAPSPLIRWTSSNSSIARIDERTGELESLAPGTVELCAQSENVKSVVTVRVLDAPRERSPSGNPSRRRLGLVLGSVGVVSMLLLAVDLSRSRGTIGGLGTTDSPGVKSNNSDSAKKKDTTKVKPTRDITLRIIRPPPATLAIGDVLRLKVSRDSGVGTERTRSTEPPVRWSSRHSDIATVDPVSGRVRAVGAGKARIVAISGAIGDSLVLEVRARPEPPPVVVNPIVEGDSGKGKQPPVDTGGTQPDEPKEPPQTSDAALIIRLDSVVRACHQAIASADISQVTALAGGTNGSNVARGLIDVLKTKPDGVSSSETIGPPAVDGNQAVQNFQVEINWTNNFGTKIREIFRMSAQATLEGKELRSGGCKVVERRPAK